MVRLQLISSEQPLLQVTAIRAKQKPHEAEQLPLVRLSSQTSLRSEEAITSETGTAATHSTAQPSTGQASSSAANPGASDMRPPSRRAVNSIAVDLPLMMQAALSGPKLLSRKLLSRVNTRADRKRQCGAAVVQQASDGLG